jgi:membrane-bound metal-dependent hydrolase YbcI (DUF457 family)
MPITPLHVGVLAPINHFFPGKFNNLAFIIVTLWLDASAIAYYALGLEMGEMHGPLTHSFMGAMLLSGIVAVLGFKSVPWIAGAFLGGMTHILLDAMVHVEMLPIYPLDGNPFYWGGMEPVSLLLVAPLIWLIGLYVSCAVHQARKILAARQQPKR